MLQISAALLDSALTRERGVCFLLGGVGDAAHLARSSDPAPFADEAPLAEQVRLHVQDVETGHAARVVGASEIHSGHHTPLNSSFTRVSFPLSSVTPITVLSLPVFCFGVPLITMLALAGSSPEAGM